MADRICVTRNGLRMKSLAPARSASMAVSRSANAVMSTTSNTWPRSRSSFSQAMPLLPGSAMSSTTRSKRWWRSNSSAASADSAENTCPTRGTSVLSMKLRMPGSSSTTSTLASGQRSDTSLRAEGAEAMALRP